MSPDPVPASPAATVLLLRDAAEGIEVLMVRRKDHGFFGGLMVFPGGGVDDVDHSDLARSVVRSGAEDHAHRAAALRELAEETGMLLMRHDVRRAPDLRGQALYETLLSGGIELDGDRLVLVSRWVTPGYAPRRFDARFYVASVGRVPSVRLDTDELTDHKWVRPAVALDRHRSGEWPMFLPTLAHLRWLENHESSRDVVAAARGADGRTLVEPKEMEDGSLVPLLLPTDRQ